MKGYRQTYDISHTLVDNEIVDHSDVDHFPNIYVDIYTSDIIMNGYIMKLV